MIAVPDFAAGAMENWGLITYRETAMLYDPMESAETNKQRVAVVVSHELAHQVRHIIFRMQTYFLVILMRKRILEYKFSQLYQQQNILL